MTKTPTTRMTRTAAQAYAMHEQAALDLLEEIRKAIRHNPMRPQDAGALNWGDVGSMERNRADLQQIADRLLGRGEYAPDAE